MRCFCLQGTPAAPRLAAAAGCGCRYCSRPSSRQTSHPAPSSLHHLCHPPLISIVSHRGASGENCTWRSTEGGPDKGRVEGSRGAAAEREQQKTGGCHGQKWVRSQEQFRAVTVEAAGRGGGSPGLPITCRRGAASGTCRPGPPRRRGRCLPRRSRPWAAGRRGGGQGGHHRVCRAAAPAAPAGSSKPSARLQP